MKMCTKKSIFANLNILPNLSVMKFEKFSSLDEIFIHTKQNQCHTKYEKTHNPFFIYHSTPACVLMNNMQTLCRIA